MKRDDKGKGKLTGVVDVIEIVLMGAFYILGAWLMDHLTPIEWYWVIFVSLPFVLGFVISRPVIRAGSKRLWDFLVTKKRWLKALGIVSVLSLIAAVALLEINYDFLSRNDVDVVILGGTLGFFGLCFLLGWIASIGDS